MEELVEPEAKPERERCDNCGGPILPQYECEQCYGEDPYGYEWFCPNCDFCCGC